MYVVKRDGKHEPVHFDKITRRITKLSYELSDYVDPVLVAQKVCSYVRAGITTTELDELAAETAAHHVSDHPDYGKLAARIAVSNLHKSTTKSFSELATQLFNYVDPATQQPAPLLSKETYDTIQANKDRLDAYIVYDRDCEYDYFGFKTLERAYLLKMNGRIAERPQHMLMRVAVGIHGNDMDAVLKTYDLMSHRIFTHASPTLFNAGTTRPQLSSCFLLTMTDDSIEGIYDTLKRCAQISKSAGGIGLSIHTIRATGSYIRGTNGVSNGLIPMLRVYNETARYVDQGGGKRKGAFAMYLEPWHADIQAFLQLRKNHGAEHERARDLFLALWVPDLFMQRVEADGEWSLMCPNEAPGLADVWGDAFVALYTRYEREGKARATVKARDLWNEIMDAQTETGTPYILYKDACNRKSNQQNLGTIRSSNLCTEIIQYSSPDEVAVCNLASVALSKFVRVPGRESPSNRTPSTTREFDHQKLYDVVRHVTRNLNKLIDINYYPIPEARRSNMRHRPMGIGVQGLADAFLLMRLPFDSPEAKTLNRDIFETMYFAALTESCLLAQEDGPYETYEGSPLHQGKFQFDLWGVTPTTRWDWATLRADIATHGVRNSLLLAPMPTASTSQILGNNEAAEPYTSNLYVRRTLAGEFVCVSRHLLQDLVERDLWNPTLKNLLMKHRGSVQQLPIPDDLKALYKTVYELSGKTLIDMAADRGAFIDQSQSFNVHMADITHAKLTSMHFYGWKKGLKTGMYYLRSKPASDALAFTVEKTETPVPASPVKPKAVPVTNGPSAEEAAILNDPQFCTMQEGCVSCGS